MSGDDRTLYEKTLALHESNLRASWAALLSNEGGRMVLMDILDRAGIAKTTAAMFTHFGNDTDLLLRGRQQLGAELLDEFVHLSHSADYYKMLKEADDRATKLMNARISDEMNETEQT